MLLAGRTGRQSPRLPPARGRDTGVCVANIRLPDTASGEPHALPAAVCRAAGGGWGGGGWGVPLPQAAAFFLPPGYLNARSVVHSGDTAYANSCVTPRRVVARRMRYTSALLAASCGALVACSPPRVPRRCALRSAHMAIVSSQSRTAVLLNRH